MLSWIVLLHSVPPKPPYLRAKVLRMLAQVGAVPLKRSAYVAPDREQCVEDFEWILRSVKEGGGEGWILRATLLAGVTDEALVSAFRAARDGDYEALIKDSRKLRRVIAKLRQPRNASPATKAEWTRIQKRLLQTTRIDFFGSAKRSEAEACITDIESMLDETKEVDVPVRADRPTGATWVTRSGIEEDRIASAWLIRRFIDPDARFRFVDAHAHELAPGEIAFDAFTGELTHAEGRCTFEVMLGRFHLSDPALRAIGEIVHDIDLKDDRFARVETPGVALAIEGIVKRFAEDEDRLREGEALMDALYEALVSRA